MLRLCNWCLNPYDEKIPRSLGEIERLQQVLKITGPAVQAEISICGSCYSGVVDAAVRTDNASSLEVGGSNQGHSNFLLRTTSKENAA